MTTRHILSRFALLTTPALVLLVSASFIAPVRADSLTNATVGVTWFYPDTSTTFATGTLAVGSTETCPGSSSISGICAGLGGPVAGSESFAVGSDTITFEVNVPGSFLPGAFNGFDFTGLTFASGGPLSGFALTTNTIPGFTTSDVSFDGSSIEMNFQGLPSQGTVELTLVTAASNPAPEPQSLTLLVCGLCGAGLFWRRSRVRDVPETIVPASQASV